MDTVNNIIFGTSLFKALPSEQAYGIAWRKDRTKDLDIAMRESFSATVEADEYAKGIADKATAKYAQTIPNFGERSVKELLCYLGIWLTQIPPKEVERIQVERRKRDAFEPKSVQKPQL